MFFILAFLLAVPFVAFADNKSGEGWFIAFLINDALFDPDRLNRDFPGAGKMAILCRSGTGMASRNNVSYEQ